MTDELIKIIHKPVEESLFLFPNLLCIYNGCPLVTIRLMIKINP